jgi:hypothetical protein
MKTDILLLKRLVSGLKIKQHTTQQEALCRITNEYNRRSQTKKSVSTISKKIRAIGGIGLLPKKKRGGTKEIISCGILKKHVKNAITNAKTATECIGNLQKSLCRDLNTNITKKFIIKKLKENKLSDAIEKHFIKKYSKSITINKKSNQFVLAYDNDLSFALQNKLVEVSEHPFTLYTSRQPKQKWSRHLVLCKDDCSDILWYKLNCILGTDEEEQKKIKVWY